MSKRSFAALWIKGAFSKSVGLGDFAGSVAGNVLTVAVHFHPKWSGTMNDLSWQVPVFALAGAIVFRVALAPYELWLEQKKRAECSELEKDVALEKHKQNAPHLTGSIDSILRPSQHNMGDRTVLAAAIVLKNVGNSATAAVDWVVWASVDGTVIPGQWHKPVPVNGIGLNRDGSTYVSPDEGVVELGLTPIVPGAVLNGSIICMFPSTVPNKPGKPFRLFIACHDIHGTQTLMSLDAGGEPLKERRYYPGSPWKMPPG